jgi:hypothetical protein
VPARLRGLRALAYAVTIGGWSPLGVPTLLSTPATASRPPFSLTPVPFTAARPGVVSRYVANDARRTEQAGNAGFSPRVVRSVAVRAGREFLAMAVGAAGQLWLTKDGTPAQRPVVGHLVRVTTSGKISLDRRIGGDPVALAASGPYVWVANGTGDGKTPEAEANTVLQIDASSGRIVHRYHINQPYEVAASGDTAWVAAAGQGDLTRMVRLDGKTGAVGRGTSLVGMTANIVAPDIVVGPTAVYVVALTAEPNQPARDVVYRLDPNTRRVTAREALPTVGVAVLAYGQGTLFATVHNVEAGGVYRLDGGTLALRQTVTTEPAQALAMANGHLWALFNYGGIPTPAYLTAFHATGGRAAEPVVLPAGNPDLIVADEKRVWVAPVGEDGGGDDLIEVAPS